MTVKERLHEQIDRMPEHRALQVQRYIEALEEADDPVLASLLAAPEDDEPETDEERVAVEEAYADIAAGRLIPHEEIMREFGG